MKIAILGGSFNPIHLGHLYLADTVISALGYDRVLLVPAFISPFKQAAAAVVSAKDRLDMILASVSGDPRIGVDDTELRREGISFTIDTVDDIIKRYVPEGKPGLVIGDDLAADFHKWKNAEELAGKTGLILARRMPQGPAFPFPHTKLENAVMNISSASVREKIADGGAWRSLTPPGARRIIERRGLYGAVRREAGESIAAVEKAARAWLKPPRFLHSRNTALMAFDLAVRFALDRDAAYLAGIGHDLGKSLDADETLALAKQDKKPITKLERKKPALLHGRAAAVLLREHFGIHNKDILEAVAVHTTGAPGMGELAKAVFIADKIECSRSGVDRRLRELAAQAGLDELFYAILGDNIRYLQSKGMDIAEETLKVELEGRGDSEKNQ